MDKECILYYRLGEFAAEIMLNGIYHPDMQISNIGFRQGEAAPLFLDFPEVEKFEMPEGLDVDRIRQLTESIFPLVDATEGSFLFTSYFRAGYLGYGGVLTWELFANAINNGFSSNVYIKHPKVKKEYDASGLSGVLVPVIEEWKSIDLKEVKLENFKTLDEYNQSGLRKNISMQNRFYLDMHYFYRSCILFSSREDAAIALAPAVLNMALAATNYGMPYTEYGLLKKCLGIEHGNRQINQICRQEIKKLKLLNNQSISFINHCVEKYDLYELLWILYDEDIFNK